MELTNVGESTRTTDALLPVPAPRMLLCAECRGLRWVKWYHPPYGGHLRHDARCQPHYGFCLHPCPLCALGLHAGEASGRLYSWLHDDPGDLPSKELATFARSWQPEAYDVASEWLRTAQENAPLPNLVFAGPPGTGKTHLVAALANGCTDLGIACLFANCRSYFDALYAAEFKEKAQLARMAGEVAVLVLDDLDKIDEGTYQKKELHALIERRTLAGVPTLITTNAEQSLRDWLLPETISRLYTRVKKVIMEPGDYRLKGRAK